ncbi:MAG: undecaprenyl-diphosphate phosphatase [Paludibacteraceae bacterium]|nr:undecaprenyl-diphosphate phosphatase [Paludibacteraceae bacterium]
MSWWEALILGIVQGLTEFLPVSSSGHLTIMQTLMGIEFAEGDMLLFDVVVHAATVCATFVVLWKEIVWLLRGTFTTPARNQEKVYAGKILVSMIPVFVVGMFFKDRVEQIFGSGLMIVGICLLVTAALLCFAQYAKPREKQTISWADSLIIGLGQALAVLPGLSRSGTTIATGILLGNKKEEVAQFSFLMVLIPILGAALLDVKDIISGEVVSGLGIGVLLIGFVAAFATGYAACRWMLEIVKKQKLIYFSIYCCIIGLFALVYGLCCG